MDKKANPKQDWGFYATTPRIVRTQYKQLSHTEKWLYVCLKDLCGDHGMCYRSLKALSEETDLSTGNLSTGIRHLHEAGLIHAEKKRRSANPTAKEVWHITIVDIWQANVEKHSKFERSDDNVQEMNNNVQNLNDVSQERSNFEAKRSNFVDRSNNTEEHHTEERTIEEYANASASHESVSSSQSSYSQSQEQSLQENGGQEEMAMGKQEEEKPARPKRARKPKAVRDELTQKRIDDVYAAMDKFKQKVTGDDTEKYQRTLKGDEAIEGLLSQNPTSKKLFKVMCDMWNEKNTSTSEYWWRKHMKPHTICSEYETRIMALEGKEVKPEEDGKRSSPLLPPPVKSREELKREAY